MNYITDNIGAKIRLCRRERGLTQEQLAEKINIAPNYLSQIENGYRGVNLVNLVKIANELEISFDYLLSDFNSSAIINNEMLKDQWLKLLNGRTPKEQKLLIKIVKDLSESLFETEKTEE